MSMTDNEVIERILYMGVGRSGLENENSCITKALKELRQYRAIGTVSEFAELKEKATAKSPAYQGEHEKCPTCESFCIGEYCIKCGQRILCD